MTRNQTGKLRNQYVAALGDSYATTPKAVYAAIALSLAMRLNDDQVGAGLAEVQREWSRLHTAGLVPQKPR